MKSQPCDAAGGHNQDSESLQIRAAQIELIFSQERVGMLGGLFTAVVMTAVLWDAAPRNLLLGWIGCFAVAWLFRYRSVLAFLKAAPKGRDILPWGRKSAIGNLIVGLAWGASAVVLFPHVSIIHQAVICFFLAAISLGTATVSFPLQEVYVSRLLAGGVPLASVLIYQGHPLYLMMAALTIVYVTVLVIVGNRMRATLCTSLKLRFENQELVNSLREEKAEIELLNDSLRLKIIGCEQMERALRDSEERFRELAELLPVIVYETDDQGRFTFVNRSGLGLGEYTLEDIADGLAVTDVVIPQDLPRVFGDLARVIRDGERINSQQYTIVKKGGSTAPVEIWSSPITRGDKVVGGRGVGVDITERKKAEEKIRTSLREKEILLREIHHRVKNNLAVISGLLRLRSRSAPKEAQTIFEDALDRIKAMATAHEKLYQSDNLATLAVRDYVESLVDHLFMSAKSSGTVVTLEKDVEELSFGLDTALPLGLLITELVSNCLKHAFPGNSKGQVEISLRSVGDHEYELTVVDNGVGIPECVDLRNPSSLGIHLVENFVRQLHGKIEINRTNGTEVRVRFREKQRRLLPT
jgi:PAS domain S-box-containing protein